MKKLILLAALFLTPTVAFAQVSDIQDLGQTVIDIINGVAVPLIFAVAFIVFIWGVFKFFILGGGNEEQREGGRDLMIWGLLGFFFMVSVWGLVNLVVNTFELDDTRNPPPFPQAEPVGR